MHGYLDRQQCAARQNGIKAREEFVQGYPLNAIVGELASPDWSALAWGASQAASQCQKPIPVNLGLQAL